MAHRTAPRSDLQSGLLFRRAEHSAVELCNFSLTQGNLLVADSPSAEEFGTTTKHSTGVSCALLKEDALGLNLIRIRLSSYSPESPAQQDIFADMSPSTHVFDWK